MERWTKKPHIPRHQDCTNGLVENRQACKDSAWKIRPSGRPTAPAIQAAGVPASEAKPCLLHRIRR